MFGNVSSGLDIQFDDLGVSLMVVSVLYVYRTLPLVSRIYFDSRSGGRNKRFFI